jgi:hypothetical protein
MIAVSKAVSEGVQGLVLMDGRWGWAGGGEGREEARLNENSLNGNSLNGNSLADTSMS